VLKVRLIEYSRTWEDRRPRLDVGFDPLNRGYNARAKVFEAFRKYFSNMPDDASPIIRERQKILAQNGICEEDRYKMQAILSTAAYPNTVPTLFWTVYEIYSRPELLEAIRQEIATKAVRRSDHGFILDLAALQTECHILLSAYQETQRMRHSQVAFRMVLEDTLLDGQYLLKKGNVLHIPAKPTHMDTSVWGPQAGVFDPYRFVPAGAGGDEARERTKIVPSSFLPWGRPPYMCPARQFASTEILMTTALLVLRVDLAPANGKGWGKPEVRSGMEVPTIPRPKEDMRLRVTAREEGAGSWAVVIGEGKTRISLASG
jgi:cytochrome P450